MLLARCTFARRGPKPERPAAINRVAVTQGTVLSLIADGGATSLNLGGEHWRDGIKDRYNLALRSWIGSAGFDRDEDFWSKRWAGLRRIRGRRETRLAARDRTRYLPGGRLGARGAFAGNELLQLDQVKAQIEVRRT